MVRHSLREKIGTIDDLPPLPAIAARIITQCLDERVNYRELGSLVKQDLALSGKVLSLINSSTYSLPDPIDDVVHAVSLLGKKTIRNLVLSISLYNIFTPEGRQLETRVAGFWHHSLGCAIAAEAVARQIGYPQPEEAYIGGLLHDLGKLIAMLRMPQEYGIFLDQLREAGLSGWQDTRPLALEERVIGIGHHQLGKWATERWDFPAVFVNTVWLHHQPLASLCRAEDRLTAIVRFADAFCNLHNLGDNYFINREAALPCHPGHVHAYDLLKRFLHLDDDTVDSVLSLVMERIGEFGDTLGMVDGGEYFSAVSHANRELGRMNLAHFRTTSELRLKDRILKGIRRLEREISQHQTPTELCRTILQESIATFAGELGLCLLKPDHDAEPVGLGYARKQFFSPLDWLNGKRPADDGTGAADRQLDSLEKMMFNPELFMASEKIIPLLPKSSLLAIPLAYHDAAGRGTIGQLVIDCRKLLRLGADRDTLFQALQIFAGTVANQAHKVLLFDRVNRQSEALAELHRQTEEMQEQLYHAQRLATVGRLAAGAAHEINNPLAVISAHTQVLLKGLDNGGSEPDTARRHYDTILRQTDQISRIITDLMTFSRPGRAHRLPADLRPIVDRALQAVAHRKSFARITPTIEFPADLPPVMVDAMQLGQVFVNLLINAQQAMPDGGDITISATRDDTRVMIRVADTGTGIPADQQALIFDPFFTTRDAGDGTGLGLAICHSFVRQNGGSITVDSTPGTGTVFIIRLPVAPDISGSDEIHEALRETPAPDLPPAPAANPAPEPEPAMTGNTAGNPSPAPGSCRVLLVEPDHGLTDIIIEGLQGNGFEIEAAVGISDGIGMIKHKLFDAVIVDDDLGEPAWARMVRWLNRIFNRLPVILLVGPGAADTDPAAPPSGIAAVCRKPFAIEDVAATIRQLTTADD
ncbi:MAG: HDOD domain-containing protein [Deltaproteobacteria bacterium]|nr:HDOD domain-containing protein [Candidatus Anaeroferrophillacea bacterium]